MISKNDKSQSINNCCLNYNQIVVEFHKREETKSSLYIPTQEGIGAWLMIHGIGESKILGRGRCSILVFYVRDMLF